MSAEDPGAPAQGRAWQLGTASALAALLTWVLQVLAGRRLGPDDYASFMVVWGFVFLEVGLLMGVQQEVTRAVAASGGDEARSLREAHPLRVGLLVGAGGGVLLLVLAPWWGPRLVGDHWAPVAGAMAVAFWAYAVYAVTNGGLAGRQRWTDISVSIALESLVRLLLVGAVVVAGSRLGAQSWALAASGLTWLLLLGRRGNRAALRQTGDVAAGHLLRRAAQAMVAAGCSGLLVSGFPVLLRLTSHGDLSPHAGVVIAAVVATRAPLLLPLNAFSTVILTRFVLQPERVRRRLLLLSVAVLAASAAGAVVGGLVGPWLLRLVYGPAFDIGAGVVAALVLAAGALAVQSISGAALLAQSRHRLFAGSWLLATLVALALLTLDVGVDARTCLALLVGPLAGVAVNVGSVLTHHRR